MNTLSRNNNNETELLLSTAVSRTDIERICGGVRALSEHDVPPDVRDGGILSAFTTMICCTKY